MDVLFNFILFNFPCSPLLDLYTNNTLLRGEFVREQMSDVLRLIYLKKVWLHSRPFCSTHFKCQLKC
jgi:hypothetical protein